MWLLTTARARLDFFPRPEDVPNGYAILSHTWMQPGEGEEDTFQIVQRLNEEAHRHSLHHSRVRAFLERAEKAGFDYAWVDTCCINKESSAELTEAINSMFRYYALSEVCYVYLSDVHTAGVKLSGPISDPDTSEDLARAFERSRWHTRGWTLQELIASRVVVFFSRQWTLLGTKHELSGLLKNITGIPAVILSLRVSFTDKSIAARMSWAAKRVTTRPEDRAYCLFGLFGVNMPTLYGEGDNAFIRLLEEIMKTSRDPTLFLWGSARDVQSLDGLVSDLREADTHARHILPSTPKEFDGCGRIGYSDHAVFRTSGSMVRLSDDRTVID
ncbi:HET-domain-containing protein [Epithele typhae]|uniref:HET-domain-containing protein n=1 Tax=Epithele typhae TaxID=378194 RepID=UPI002008B8A5|nr:HET-domain-containing protein [Epithele typhae]KAH9910747.1 HET-domain-containing protein [Epithele typhae]